VGHYLERPGATSVIGRAELAYNLDLALKVREELLKLGIKVRMIGERGDYAELHRRTHDARGVDLFVSIHHDSVQEKYLAEAADSHKFSGFSLFVSRRNPFPEQSRACASAMGLRLREAGLVPSLYHADAIIGEGRPFADEANGVHWYDNLAVGHTASMPSVLVEGGVIVNRRDEERMRNPAVQSAIARAVAEGANACLQSSTRR
jgi:N-acetylmuramoyl-L-alanine amidase